MITCSLLRRVADLVRRGVLQDISARSPIVNHDAYPTRRSMDSSRMARMPRQRLFERDPPTAVEEGDAEGFEEVGLNDENNDNGSRQSRPSPQVPALARPKKKGFFAKFSDHNNQENSDASLVASPSPTTSRFSILPGRKRGQSGQGAELGSMERPATANRDSSAAKEMTDTSAHA